MDELSLREVEWDLMDESLYDLEDDGDDSFDDEDEDGDLGSDEDEDYEGEGEEW